MRGAWVLPDVRSTQSLGSALGRHAPLGPNGPRLLFLSGELGTGKTTLTAALFAMLGVREAVRSPTYALIETYPVSAGHAVHVDLYRLRSAEELEQLGLHDYLQANTLLVVEWPERLQASLPQPDLLLTLAVAGEGRVCSIEAFTGFGEAWLALVEREIHSSDAG